MEGPTAYRGARFHIQYAVGLDDSCPAKDFFDSLDEKDQARVMALFVRMGDHGEIRNPELFKKVEGTDYFEFKRFQIRILCRFQPGGHLILLHGFRKKQDRIPRAEIEKADRIFNEFIRRQPR